MAAFHVLLIGIDDYARQPLHGCVHDVDAVERLLVSTRGGVPAAQICRLVSPLSRPSGPPATLAAIRDQLARLASPAVAADDRVIIFFAGHGCRIAVAGDGPPRFRDALVPVDAWTAGGPRLLYADDLAAHVAAITARTAHVTVVLDTCFSPGVPRARELPGQHPRFVVPPPGLVAPRPVITNESACLGAGVVAAACLDHEAAYEVRDHLGGHGLFTRAWLDALAAFPGDLHHATWNAIWPATRAALEDVRPWQHAWLAGNPARGVLAGPPVDGEPGLSVIRTRDAAGHDQLHVAAGTLAGVGEGAVLAIYADRPRQFPRLDSSDDLAARVDGTWRVARATRDHAIAEPIAPAAARALGLPAVPPGDPAELPATTRGRIIAAGAPERLRCALVPDDAELADQLARSPLVEIVEPRRADVQLALAAGRWFVCDDVHGAHADEPVLVALGPHDLPRARAILEHYHAYALPARMAARATGLPGGLAIALHTAPTGDRVPPGRIAARYELTPDTAIFAAVRNTSRERLRVTLVCAMSSGKVELYGDRVIDAGTVEHFGRLDAPFRLSLANTKQRGVDRLIAIGTPALTKDLGHLRLDATFAQLLDADRNRRPTPTAIHRPPPPEQWTCAQLVLDLRR